METLLCLFLDGDVEMDDGERGGWGMSADPPNPNEENATFFWGVEGLWDGCKDDLVGIGWDLSEFRDREGLCRPVGSS